MKRVRVVVNSWLEPGILYFLPDNEADEFDVFSSNVWNSNALILACHPDDEELARDRLAIAQEFAP